MKWAAVALRQVGRGTGVALRDAQRAWVPFRDAARTAEGHVSFGRSIRPMVVSGCLERMTRARAEELRSLAEPH